MRASRQQLRVFSTALFVLAACLLVAGAVISWRQRQAVQGTQKQVRHTTVEPAPSTTKPKEDEFAAHTAPADQPRYLFIPDISVRAIVKPLGLTADNRIAAPSNVFYAGWYTGSVKPGAPGAMLIDGHVSSWTSHGVFYDLKKMHTGQILTVQRGDNTKLTYKVVRTQTYADDKVDMDAALAPVNPNKPGLNLITCTGSVKKGTSEFNQRLVVFAEQL